MWASGSVGRHELHLDILNAAFINNLDGNHVTGVPGDGFLYFAESTLPNSLRGRAMRGGEQIFEISM